jgi:ubiquinone/menaquinone biosynthesis C-methylase UbiE
MPLDWKAYAHPYPLTTFASGSRVLDLGCGDGAHVAALRRLRCRAVGVDVLGIGDVQARAEALPFRAECFDGVLASVSLPYLDERRAIREIARVLRGGGMARIVTHGSGYYLRYLLCGTPKQRVYAARTLLNSWIYWLLGRRVVGDTLYHNRARIRGWCRDHGFAVLDAAQTTYCGLPVFLYVTLERRQSPSGPE